MRKIEMPVAKTAIQELTGDQLELLVKFGKSVQYKLIEHLSQREKYLRYQQDILNANSVESINMLKGINIGMDYIIDSVNRAQEELQSRGSEVDNEE